MLINCTLLLLLGLAATGAPASDEPVVTYTKSFPGSVPAYVSVEVHKDGSAIYKEAVDDEEPVSFRMSPEDTAQIFGFADRLDHFKHPLESGLKVANMGQKTFRYQA